MDYSELLKLCEKCNFQLEAQSLNDERYVATLEHCECDICKRRGKVFVLNIPLECTDVYKKYF
jgi:hypothetical protein